jgi:DNA protecting protein DprA
MLLFENEASGNEEGTPMASDARTVPLPFFTEGSNQAIEPTLGQKHDPDFDLYFLALSQLRGLGVNSIRALIDHYEDLSDVWRDSPKNIRSVLAGARVPNSEALAQQVRSDQPKLLGEGRQLRDYLANRNVQLIASSDPLFPHRLKDIPDAPYWLFVEGDPDVLNAGPVIAVVGTRQSSEAGIRAAEHLTYLASVAGFGLVSGLAEGIDAAAHAIAARRNIPQIAVLGTGINITFPNSTATTRRHLLDTGGCVISEYLPNDNYGKSRFVQRNRIQAGLASAVCPVEGKGQSGTMHTVRFAAKYRRPLFTVVRDLPHEDNDMPVEVQRLGGKVFDIASHEGKAKLRQFLDELPGSRFPPPERPDPAFLFRNVFRAVDSIMSYDEPTRDEKQYLLNEIQLRLKMDQE